ncbi:MAG: peptidase domain protein [Chitinophagaceae bacterium]|nr:peptidase domain protein [Chitinophagaceae bacterium]
MKRNIILFIPCLFILAQLQAQHINYNFSAPNAAHHEATITLLAENIGTAPAVFRMSRSSPGRYATHEFGKNVYDVKAYDGKGNMLKVQKTDAEIYTVAAHQGTVRISYTIYGNYADGTYMNIDPASYHLNMPATFMWVKGFDKAPITIHFDIPANFKIATQLKPTSDPNTFTAPGLQLFMDSPTKIGNLFFSDWTESNPGKAFKFRLALEANTTQAGADSFAVKLKKIVETERDVFGEFPDYDFGMYTFIASINPYVRGDGMEHRNSTMITSGNNFTGRNNQLGVFAHEFFHNWNVERIRPKSIEPFNFEKSNMSEGLWLAEGFTQYYGEMILVRAGFTPVENYLNTISGLINTKENTPGAKYYSPIENSQRAVFVDAGVSIDKTNYPNMFSSYYTYGGATALALDLDLRSRFNKTLDDFMKVLWKRFGKTEIPYTIPGLQDALASITNASYASDFFSKYIYGHTSFDYAAVLQKAGFALTRLVAGKAWLGSVNWTPRNNEIVIGSNTIRDTPLYAAGLDIDDVLLELDGQSIKQASTISDILAAHKPGDILLVSYRHREETKSTTVNLGENPAYTIVAIEKQGSSLTNEQQAFRKNWLHQ